MAEEGDVIKSKIEMEKEARLKENKALQIQLQEESEKVKEILDTESSSIRQQLSLQDQKVQVQWNCRLMWSLWDFDLINLIIQMNDSFFIKKSKDPAFWFRRQSYKRTFVLKKTILVLKSQIVHHSFIFIKWHTFNEFKTG